MATTMNGAGPGMTIGSVLSGAFAALGKAPALFFGVSFVLVALPSAASQWVTRSAMATTVASGTDPFGALLPIIGVTALVWLFLYQLVQAILFRATVTEIDGRPETFADHLAAAFRALLPLVGLAILLTVAVWIGTLLLIVPGIVLALMWSVAAPALVVEGTGVIGAFGRSRYLTSGARWRILGLVLLVFATYFVASAVVGLGSLATTGLTVQAAAQAGPSIVSLVVSIVVQTIFIAVWSAIQGSLYVDLRTWKDGPTGDRLADIFA